jgi:UPF0755 protein
VSDERGSGEGRPTYADDVYLDGPRAEPTRAVPSATVPSATILPPPAPPRSRRPRRRTRHPILLGLAAVLVVVVVVAAVTFVWALHQINPGGKPGHTISVTIPAGASTAKIGRLLAADRVIHDGGLFRIWAGVEGAGPFLAGTYRLATNESYSEVAKTLEAGAPIPIDRLVIPEGFTLQDIAARVASLAGMHISAASFLALSSSGSVRSPYEPAGVDDLEGLVFPATYDIATNESASEIMEYFVQTFDQRAQALGLVQAAASRKMTPYQLVEVASIVQGEAKYPSQFADVAGVIYNRLANGTPLGTDSTLIYWLRQRDPDLTLSRVDYNQASPYNTRLHTGLPPSPIDSPGAAALEAAIHPAKTSYEYFVEINPDGQLGFASTPAGFDQLQAECQAHGLC